MQQEKKQAEGNASFYNSGDKREREGEDTTVGQSAENVLVRSFVKELWGIPWKEQTCERNCI